MQKDGSVQKKDFSRNPLLLAGAEILTCPFLATIANLQTVVSKKAFGFGYIPFKPGKLSLKGTVNRKQNAFSLN